MKNNTFDRRILLAVTSLLCIWLLGVTTALHSAVSLPTELKTPALFADNMVLQRDAPCNIWGDGVPGSKVTVSFQGQTKSVMVDAAGHWSLKLDPMKATGEGRDLIISSQGKSVTLRNVVVGDVWICGGQSNMGVPLNRINDIAPEFYQQLLKSADYPDIRYTSVRESISPLEEMADVSLTQSWLPLDQKTVVSKVNPSGICFFFAAKLNHELGIPIGIIKSNVGGTSAESWMSMQTLRSSESGRKIVSSWEEVEKNYTPEKLQKYIAEQTVKAAAGGNQKEITQWNNPKAWPKEPLQSINYPDTLFNGMIAPLARMTIRGFVWDQGENNNPRAWQYRELLSLLIADWRSYWKQGNGEQAATLPFYMVQLQELLGEKDRQHFPPSPGDRMAELRDAQRHVAETTPYCAIAVTIDHHEKGVTHPLLKSIPGERLAAVALAKTYGRSVVWRGPTYRSQKVEGEKIRVEFDGVGSGLMVGRRTGTNVTASPTDQPLDYFAIAGDDGVYSWANARIEDESVVVWSDRVKSPKTVRYAWEANPEGCNLYNKEGWPATPFRTDDLPYATKNEEDPLSKERAAHLFSLPR